jgi:hypothetical protein
VQDNVLRFGNLLVNDCLYFIEEMARWATDAAEVRRMKADAAAWAALDEATRTEKERVVLHVSAWNAVPTPKRCGWHDEAGGSVRPMMAHLL